MELFSFTGRATRLTPLWQEQIPQPFFHSSYRSLFSHIKETYISHQVSNYKSEQPKNLG
jgi:hypothetical protein